MKNLIFLTLILFTASCSKSDVNVDVKGEVFSCCNIWEDFKTADNTTSEAVADFLTNSNISFSDLEIIDVGLAAVCVSCCQCPEGMEVQFTVDEEDLQAVLDLGFEQ